MIKGTLAKWIWCGSFSVDLEAAGVMDAWVQRRFIS